MSTVAGTLHVLWENDIRPEVRPRYRLLFDRHSNVKSGQRSKRLLGKHRLESYLLKIELTAQDAKHWIQQVHQKQYVSIPNVMMPQEQMAMYEQPMRRRTNSGSRTAFGTRNVFNFNIT